MSPITAPTERLLPSLSELTREQALDRVDAMTDADLDKLMHEIEDAPRVPTVFEDTEMIARIEARINHTNESRTQWEALKTKIEEGKEGAMEKAEENFLQKMQEKGGGLAALAAIGVSILAFFGFSGAMKLKGSLKNKGYLRTAVEGAKEHPIFAALIAAMGIKIGSEAYSYVKQNQGIIEKRVEEIAGERGVAAVNVIDQIADGAIGLAANGADKGLRGTLKFLAWALRGEYNEETGVVDLPHASLRPPVIVAFQAGVRRNGGPKLVRGLMNRFVVEDKLNAIMRQTNVVAHETKAHSFHKKALAERALNLMNSNKAVVGSGTPESLELERIFGVLSDDLKLSKNDMVEEIRLRPDEAKKRIQVLEGEMLKLQNAEMGDFKVVKDNVNTMLADAEIKMADGKVQGSTESYKKKVIGEAQTMTSEYHKRLTGQKLALSNQLTDALNHLSDTDALNHRTANRLDASSSATTKVLDYTTRKAERIGLNIKRVPGGKWVTRGIIGYSFMPLAMEALASRRPGAEGEAATEALKWDAGEAALGFVPGVGEVMDFRTAIMGTDLNGREIDTWGRVVAGTMGTLGIASIGLGFFTGGTSILGFKALRGAVAAGKAVRTIKKAEKGIEVVGATSKSIKLLKAGQKNKERLEGMLKLTNAQKKARKIRSIVQNGQRGMQVVTYGMLGLNVASGAMELYNSTENIGEAITTKATEGINAARSFAHEKLS